MADKKVQIKNTGGDALYPRTSLENLVSVVGSTTHAFLWLNEITDNPYSDPEVGNTYFSPTEQKVYQCVTLGTWAGKK